MPTLFPTRRQFARWTLPNKLAVVAFYVTLVSFALVIVFYVVPPAGDPPPARPPIPLDEIEVVRAQGLVFAAKIRSLPMASSIFASELEPLAEKVWADERYSAQAPRESALVLRLYAATLLMARPADGGVLARVRNSLPWLNRSIEFEEKSDSKSSDLKALKAAREFFRSIAAGRVPNVDAQVMFRHQFRVAMPEADEVDVQDKVDEAVGLLSGLVAPRANAGGASAREDFEYLQAYRIPAGFTIGQAMSTLQLTLKGTFPDKDVGGDPIFVPLPNGHTKVMYVFHGNSRMTVQWEVSKAEELVRPLNDAAESFMQLSRER